MVSWPKVPFVQPYVRCKYYNKVGSKSPVVDTFWFSGITKEVVLGKELAGRPCVLNLKVSIAYAETVGFVFGRLITSLDAPLSKHWTLSPSLIYQVDSPEQWTDPNGYADGNECVYGASLKYEF
jgi:hypothetical protein